jgi:phage baseplate assembly protein gpV/phage protein D
MMPLAAIPQLRIEIAGRALNVRESSALSGVVIQQRLSAPALCELSFVDLDENEIAGATFLPGLSMQVSIGQASEPVFSGEVTAIEHQYLPNRVRSVRIRGYDKLHRLRKRQPVRAHVQVTLAALAQEVVDDLGIRVEGPDATLLWKRLIQYRLSDFDLLQNLAENSSLYFTLRGDTLHLISLRRYSEPKNLRLGRELLEARVESNGDSVCREVRAFGWDPSHFTWHQSEASYPAIRRETGVRMEPRNLGGSGERTLANQTSPDTEHASALAQAELDSRVARELVFTGTALGDPELYPGRAISVSRMAAALDGTYVLTSVRHVVNRESGFVSEISTEPPPRRPRDNGFFAAPATVSRVNDPENLGRIQVSLPTCGDLETDWLCVLSAGAGASKGLMALPDVGDQVIVLVSSENPALGLVLGSVYGSGGFPDSGIEAGVVARYTLLTPGGQRLRMDDSRNSIRFENKEGSFIELLPHQVKVHAATDMVFEAPGRNLVIQAEKIDFRRA